MRNVFAAVASVGMLFLPSTARTQNSGSVGLISRTISPRLSGGLNACDLNLDGTVNVVDVQMAVNMYLGLLSCNLNIMGVGVCNATVVGRVATAALGGTCDTTGATPHSVTLNWAASTSGNVVGYNVYRSTVSGGPYTKLNSTPMGAITFNDATVQ